jgi:CRP/FNR family transcriptional regulator, cyclic AMP receptor protein
VTLRGLHPKKDRVVATPDSDPFAAVADASMRALAERGVVRRYRRGTILIEEGDVGDTLYVVLTGRLRVFSSGGDGARDREITFNVHGPGECVGEMSLDGGPRSASVITVEPTTCSVITRTTLRAQIARDPDLALGLIGRVIRRARLATESARGMATLDVYGRLARRLEAIAVDDGSGVRRVPERTTHALLASEIGCSREMVSRLMKDLVRGGYVALEGRRIALLKTLPRSW